jgi:hypothetical protein
VDVPAEVPVQVDQLRHQADHQRLDRLQRLRPELVELEPQIGEAPHHQAGEDLALVREVRVQGAGADPGPLRDRAHVQPLEALLLEQVRGRAQDVPPATGAVAPFRLRGGARRGVHDNPKSNSVRF